MKLIVPFVREMRPVDARLIALAEFLGIVTAPVSLAAPPAEAQVRMRAAAAEGDCLLLNPDVLCSLSGGGPDAHNSVAALVEPFRFVLVHAVRPDPLHSALIASITGGGFQGVQSAPEAGAPFSCASDSRDICRYFAGISLAASNPAYDCTFSPAHDGSIRKLITIGAEPFFATLRHRNTDIFLLGSGDVADLETQPGDSWYCEYFSRFVPQVMALRHIFGEQSWVPAPPRASLIVDDPLLRSSYGFLNFAKLLRLMEEHRFTTTIAFIPRNCRRTSPKIARLFRDHADRLSLCFHGNDHTGAEFAATDAPLLNAMLRCAEERIAFHTRVTGIPCDRVMVFPQGKFSVEAMAALRSRSFEGAVNTVPHPYQQPNQLTLRELAQPAVVRYGGFPLFVRRNSTATQPADIAFRLFFGVPILIVEHHNVFENPAPLLDAVRRIHEIAPDIQWSAAGDAVRGSYLRRRDPNGTLRIRAYSSAVNVRNPGPSPEAALIEWEQPGQGSPRPCVYRDQQLLTGFEDGQGGICISAHLDAAACHTFSLQYRSVDTPLLRLGFRSNARAFLRRRLSEIRDNYLSRNPALLMTAKTLQRRFLQ